MSIPFKSLLYLTSDGGNRADPPFMLCTTLANNQRSCHQASGLGSCGSMRSHTETDLPGISRDPVLRGPTASSIQVISSEKGLYHKRSQVGKQHLLLFLGGFSNRWWDFDSCIFSSKTFTFTWLTSLCHHLYYKFSIYHVLYRLLYKDEMEATKVLLPSKLDLCQLEAIKSHSQPTLFS